MGRTRRAAQHFREEKTESARWPCRVLQLAISSSIVGDFYGRLFNNGL